MREVLTVVAHKLQSWQTDLRVIAAFLLGIALCIGPVSRYMAFANVLGSSVQIFEPFIYMGSTVSMFTQIWLGVQLMMSDAPFLRERSPYEILRIGKKRWISASILYVIAGCLLYMLAMLLVAMLLALAAGSVDYSNRWSDAMVTLAEKQPDFAVVTYSLKFAYPEFISAVRPWGALLQTLLYNGLYLIVISLCIFAVNLWSGLSLGWLAAAAVHIVGYVIYANGAMFFPQKLSLLSCAIPAYHYAEGYGITSLYAAGVLGGAVLALIWLSKRAYRHLEPFQKCGV
ncbi:MAG: hypothetical protein LUH36_05015 [Oscillospiraceae bacterium]|nr:hypothetical protein [Oscillospiraceae bacterium]